MEERSCSIFWSPLELENKPFLIIINGAPGTGKTTLARRLAGELGLLLISKDDFKEILFDNLGSQDRAWSQKLGYTSIKLLFHLLECQLRAGGSAIVETAFIPQFDTPRFLQLKQQYGFGPFQILCTTAEQTLVERFLHRAQSDERHPGHLDHQVSEEQVRETLRSDKYGVLEIGGTVFELDTTDFERVDYDKLLLAVETVQESEL
jgi:predicted kinase